MNRVLLAALFLLGCGGSTVVVDEPSPPVQQAEPEPPGPASPWALPRSALVELVQTAAPERIREADSSLDLTQLPAWAQSPQDAPPLGDRVCEQLMNLAIAEAAADRPAQAEALVRLVRAKARNRNNAYAGSTILAELARRQAPAGQERAAVRAVLAELPRNRFGASTVIFQLFQNEGQVSARIEQLHQQLVSLDTVASALFYEAILGPIVQSRALFLEVIEAIRAEHAAQPEPAAYAFSTVDLTRARDAQPVLIAVWDTGTSPERFGSQLFSATVDGAEVHGVIADPTPGQTGLVYQPSEETIRQYAPFLRGIMDLRAGLASSDAARRVLELMGGVQNAEALDQLTQNLDAIGEWAHGTHVAGIMLAGLPQARLAVFRSAWAGEARLYHNRGPTDPELAAERANVDAIASFINTHRVRVVNASLGFSQDYLENQLRHEGDRYDSDEDVRARAAEVHAHRRESWTRVFTQCPDTLFVVAAGNSNRDVVEYADVPAALDLPNVLVVGAVDRFGSWATFTSSNPERVRVFDHGVEVDSVIPNGERVPLSGTSMASPNVANLAAKMVSVDPALTPARIITIVEETGEPIAAPFNGRIAHEERALARVRRERRPARR